MLMKNFFRNLLILTFRSLNRWHAWKACILIIIPTLKVQKNLGNLLVIKSYFWSKSHKKVGKIDIIYGGHFDIQQATTLFI